MRKFLLAIAVAVALIAGVAPASASAAVQKHWMTVAWTMDKGPSEMWPQTYWDSVKTDSPQLGALDKLFDGKRCIGVQIDVYQYTDEGDVADVDKLINGEHLYGPSNPVHEPLIAGGEGTAWKFYRNDECASAPKKVTRVFQVDTYLNPTAKLAKKAAGYDNDGKLKWGEDKAHYGHSFYQTVKVTGLDSWSVTDWISAINKATTKKGVGSVSKTSHVGTVKKGQRLTVAWLTHGSWKKHPQTFFARR